MIELGYVAIVVAVIGIAVSTSVLVWQGVSAIAGRMKRPRQTINWDPDWNLTERGDS